jgi:arsenite methyltransferase
MSHDDPSTTSLIMSLDVEAAVRQRYSHASQEVQASLCCPVDYDPKYLEVLPGEMIERDYGCGDPSKYVKRGEYVLDLGSGGGKVCFIASQVVGSEGAVTGVDMNDNMLALARQHREEIGNRIGHHNVEFRKGRIQDLALDLDRLEEYLAKNPVSDANDWLRVQAYEEELRTSAPMIPSGSIDVVISNCVLNLVNPNDRRQLFEEVFRVLRRGGRIVISDIVCDEPVPVELQNDAELWSGCISGAFVESDFLSAFAEVGFYGIELLDRNVEPWAVVNGIEFRSVTVQAFKGKEGPCMDHNEAVVYRGPWKSVTDDDGHVLRRGEPMAVCRKTFEIYNRAPYSGQIVPVPPRQVVGADEAQPFDCRCNAVRDPRESKGESFDETQLPEDGCCSSGGNC